LTEFKSEQVAEQMTLLDVSVSVSVSLCMSIYLCLSVSVDVVCWPSSNLSRLLNKWRYLMLNSFRKLRSLFVLH